MPLLTAPMTEDAHDAIVTVSERGRMPPVPLSDDLESIAELRVAASTPPKELAGSIIHLLNENRHVKLSAIGHQSVGQAIKAIPVVNQYCIAQGFIVAILPAFELKEVQTREVSDEARMQERTVMMLKLIKISPQ
jgi:stage V sporulation protein SpoVS